MFSNILIANRGEIACRVMDTACRMGIKTVAVYSEADTHARHVKLADEAVLIGSPPVSESYLRGDAIIQAALDTSAEAIHPGYGFLSENPDFVDSIEAAGLIFIGPSSKAIRSMGLKDAAKKLMEQAGVPVVPGYHGEDQDPALLKAQADTIGYPVLIKARAGGGGKGMRLVEQSQDFSAALESAAREGQNAFGDPAVLIEKYITSPRHIEVQVFGDSHGNVVHLFERDCSLQRRHQKVIEEAPAPDMPDDVRDAMTSAAVKAAKAIGYENAGTVEFIVDGSGPLRTDGFWFMEMNTRLQVEHPVTEAITGLDLVEMQLQVAAGEPLPVSQMDIQIQGHALEARLYAEDVPAGFLPAVGRIEHLEFSKSARNDTGVEAGAEISSFYDPMIAKIITHSPSRSEALKKLEQSLCETHIAGLTTNRDFLSALCRHQEFAKGEVDTGLIARDLDRLTDSGSTNDIDQALAAITLSGICEDKPHSNWRLWGDAERRVTLQRKNGTQETLRLRVGGHGQVACLGADGSVPTELFHVSIHNGIVEFELNGVKDQAKFYVWKDKHGTRHTSLLYKGRNVSFESPNPLNRANSDVGNSGSVTAPMSGTVLAVHVTVGAKVAMGDRLAVVEAMKMEMAVTSPRDGIVSEVRVKTGQAVEGGVTLVLFEDDD